MAELQQNRYDRLIRRVGGIVGVGSMVSDALSELFPMIDVERVPSELLALQGTHLAGCSVESGGTAAVNNQHQVFNPVGSGHLITVTHALVASATTQILFFGLASATLATVIANPRFRDGRVSDITPVGQNRVATLAAATPSTYRVQVNGGAGIASFLLDDPNDLAVLPPGFGFQVSTSTVNTSLVTSFFWRERPAERSELNL